MASAPDTVEQPPKAENGAMAPPPSSAPTTPKHGLVLRLSRFMVHHTCAMLLVEGIVILLLVVLWQSGALETGDSAGDSPGQLLALDEVEVKRFHAVLALEDENIDENLVVPPLSESRTQLLVYYSAPEGGNVFTVANVRAMFATEQQIQGLDTTRGTIQGFEDFCFKPHYLDANDAPVTDGCLPVFSAINDVIFAGRTNVTADDVDALTQADIDAALAGVTEQQLGSGVDYFFARDFFDSGRTRSRYTRSLLYFGLPLNRTTASGDRVFNNQHHREDDQDDIFLDFVKQYEDLFDTDDPPGLAINYVEEALASDQISRLVQGDFLLAGVSAVLVFLLLSFQLRSFFLSFTGVLQIVVSYPLALVIYHGVFQIEINTQLNLLAVFVVLGIGADDLYVFYDAWVQSASQPDLVGGAPLEKRMAWVWHRSATAMGSTSLTTFVAFVVTAASPIPAISVFGILSATMVAAVYLLTIGLFPLLVIINYRYLEARKFLCLLKPHQALVDAKSPAGTHVTTSAGTAPSGAAAESAPSPGAMSQPDKGDVQDLSSYRWIERVFFNVVAPAVHRFRVLIAVVFGVAIIFSIWGTTEFDVPNEEEVGLPKDSELYKVVKIDENFPPNNQIANTRIAVVWGLDPDDPVDRDGLDRNDEDNFGKIVRGDPARFQPHLLVAQQYFNSTCQLLATRNTTDGDPFADKGQVRCFIRDYWAFEETEFGRPPADTTSSEFLDRVQAFVSHVTADGQQPYLQYEDDLGGVSRSDATEVTYLKLTVNTTIPTFEISLSERTYWFDNWAAVMREINADAPTELSQGFQTEVTTGMWAFHRTSEILVSSTLLSLLISFVVASACLLVVSRNFIISGLAAVVLLGVVVTIIALLVAIGSSLGVIEAIICSLLIGLSIDYSFHIVTAFNMSKAVGRFERAREALLDIGVSILGGYFTTLSAAFLLLFAQLTFFVVFGKVLCLLFTTSLLYALLLLPALLMMAGPVQHPTGDLLHVLKQCARKCGYKGTKATQPATSSSHKPDPAVL